MTECGFQRKTALTARVEQSHVWVRPGSDRGGQTVLWGSDCAEGLIQTVLLCTKAEGDTHSANSTEQHRQQTHSKHDFSMITDMVLKTSEREGEGEYSFVNRE